MAFQKSAEDQGEKVAYVASFESFDFKDFAFDDDLKQNNENYYRSSFYKIYKLNNNRN